MRIKFHIKKNSLPKLKKAGVSGIIVSDVNLVPVLIEHGINPVTSSMCGIYNTDLAQIYYDMGVNRLIPPRDLSL